MFNCDGAENTHAKKALLFWVALSFRISNRDVFARLFFGRGEKRAVKYAILCIEQIWFFLYADRMEGIS